MELRLRAILTRIQTMKSSTLVAIAIMFGLLIVVHIKQSDYNDRVKEREERNARANEMTDTASTDKTSVDRDNDSKETTTSKTTQSTTSGTEESYELDELDDEQKVEEDYEENADDINDAKVDGVTHDSKYSIREYGVSNVGDTKVFTTQNESDQIDGDDGDYDNDNEDETEATNNDDYGEDDNDYDNDNEDETEATNDDDYGEDDDDYDNDNEDENEATNNDDYGEDDDDYDNDNEDENEATNNDDYGEDDDLVASNEMDEEMMDITNNDIDDNNKIHEQIEDSIMRLSYDKGEMPDIENDKTQVNVPSLTTFNDEQEAKGLEEQREIENVEIQKLVQKYPDTLEDENLRTQGEMYVERLRNKLSQIGRLDIIYKPHCNKKLPSSIIIGVMKSGTEAFSTFLGIHPQIAMQFGYTAMDFFSNTELYNQGRYWYRTRMMCSTEDQVTIEKSPQYFSSMMAPKRIFDMNKDMKLILLVRDPIARAISHFLQQQQSHPERMPAASFEDCVYDRNRKQVIGTSQYIYQSTYSVILKRWFNYFPYRQILVVDGDTFRENPIRSLTKTEKFLNINPYFDESKLYYNEEKGFYCLQTSSDSSDDCLKGGKGRTHPEIEAEVEMALRQYFKPYNEEFIRLTGMRFDW